MELKAILEKSKIAIRPYWFILIILAAGLVMMLLPTEKKEAKNAVKSTEATDRNIESLLEAALQQIDGVGEVHLLLTVDNSGETFYQTDRDSSSGEANQSNSSDTVIITDSNRNESGLIKKRIEPIYRGAVVICKGGANPHVQLAVTHAVMKSTGLSADQICVLKMK